MTLPSSFIDPLLRIHQSLSQYPILRTRIRSRMRKEIFSRGILTAEEFKIQVREQAISSQSREGMLDPFGEEPEDIWRTGLQEYVLILLIFILLTIYLMSYMKKSFGKC